MELERRRCTARQGELVSDEFDSFSPRDASKNVLGIKLHCQQEHGHFLVKRATIGAVRLLSLFFKL